MYQSSMNQVPSLVTYAVGDVTGDGVLDYVYLTAIKTDNSPYLHRITLFVQDGRTGAVCSVVLPEDSGYEPTLFLGDFTGDQVDDIFISVATGGSGGVYNHYIYSFASYSPRLLFDSALYNQQYQYEVTYQDQYKVSVLSEENGLRYIIDISTRDQSYLNEIYDEAGKLKEPITGFVNPLSGMYAVDFDYDGVYELLCYQKIAGRYNADGLGYVMNTLGWQANRFILERQNVAIYGTEE
ncbi:VCBS repeat-containing protein [Paraliobacillus salinarum]|uniref:VCBS repeat-containing protein n=1 Tax=Paraliobacillus salinarum TaxID=1158996 RepID=UPI0015F68638|nr:VCBS repeat-containing protein [Paraliobacillus salinarum]